MTEASTPPPPAEEPDASKRKKTLVIVLVLVLILAAIGIGIVAVLSSQPPAAPRLGTLLVIPNEVTLDIGGEKLFHARPLSTDGRVLQANQVTVTWYLAPAAVGTIGNTTGLDTIYNDPSDGKFPVTVHGTNLTTGFSGSKTSKFNTSVTPSTGVMDITGIEDGIYNIFFDKNRGFSVSSDSAKTITIVSGSGSASVNGGK